MTKTHCTVPKHTQCSINSTSLPLPEVTGDPHIENLVGLEKGNSKFEMLEGKYPVWVDLAAKEKIQMTRV